jgi:NADP-dependent 3-hydroxy acid dehydrogenase YdfG
MEQALDRSFEASTGASSGIGDEFAKHIVQHEVDLLVSEEACACTILRETVKAQFHGKQTERGSARR